MRINLRLHGLELHAGGELGLLLQVGQRKLRRKQLGEALGNCLLVLAQVMRITIVELERADDALIDDERDDNARLELARLTAETHGARCLEHARDAIFERHVRTHRLDG